MSNKFEEWVSKLDLGPELSGSPEIHDQLTNTWGKTINFLKSNNLLRDEGPTTESIDVNQDINVSAQAISNIQSLDTMDIINLCRECNVHADLMSSAVEQVGLLIHKGLNNNFNIADHFKKADQKMSYESYGNMFPQKYGGDLSADQMSVESFGSDMKATFSDIRIALATTLVQMNKSIVPRFLTTVTSDQPFKSYDIPLGEVYDLTSSRNASTDVREGSHRVPLIDLLTQPDVVSNQLKPVNCWKANDPGDLLIEDNVIRSGYEVKLFDLNAVAGDTRTAADYTTVLSDGVLVKSLRLRVTLAPATTEEPIIENFNVDLGDRARLTMMTNNMDSGDRSCNIPKYIYAFDKTSKQLNGTASNIFSALSSDVTNLKCTLNISSNVNLRYGSMFTIGTVTSKTVETKDGTAIASSDNARLARVTVEVIGWTPEAEISEENLRNTTIFARLLSTQKTYEIQQTRNVAVEVSLRQVPEREIINTLSEITAIGNDGRFIKLMTANMNSVHDRVKQEQKLAAMPFEERINASFVAGSRVNPYFYVGSLDMKATGVFKNVRSGDYWGDLRGLFEAELLQILSEVMVRSNYMSQLNAGERPVFNVLTGITIMDALLSVPHLHNHVQAIFKDEKTEGDVQFRHVLPNGYEVRVITTNFMDLRDKLYVVPYRPGQPKSELNYAQNIDMGTFTMRAQPTNAAAVTNFALVNHRQFPIVTNPIGALLTIKNLATIQGLLSTEFGELAAQ